ncbi:hypothetical protein ACO0QE_002645 [Hanseniaspora vineae]
MLVVGLTGGIACGKSSVSNIIQEEFNNSIPIIDADLIAREIVEPGKPAYNKIVLYFQNKIPDLINPSDQTLNRPNLGKYVFSNKDELLILNNITHPQVRYEIFKKIFINYIKGYKMCILDVPLLFEAKLDIFCGKTVSVVISDQSVQLKRLITRNGFSEEEAMSRINAQMSTKERIYRSSFIIDNNGTFEELRNQVKNVVLSSLKPGLLSYLLELIPPIGLCSALNVIISNYLKRNLQKNKFAKAE